MYIKQSLVVIVWIVSLNFEGFFVADRTALRDPEELQHLLKPRPCRSCHVPCRSTHASWICHLVCHFQSQKSFPYVTAHTSAQNGKDVWSETEQKLTGRLYIIENKSPGFVSLTKIRYWKKTEHLENLDCSDFLFVLNLPNNLHTNPAELSLLTGQMNSVLQQLYSNNGTRDDANLYFL